MSNRIKLLAIGAIAALTVAAVWTVTSGSSTPGPSPAPSVARASATPLLPAAPVVATHADQALGANAPQSPTGRGAQSMLWVTGGTWWAAMIEPKSQTYHIFQLIADGAAWRDTGTVIDERAQAQPDCLWDAQGKHLYILSGGRSANPSAAARLTRYSYDEAGQRFILDPNFPIEVTDRGFESMVLARDSTGKLWMTYIADNGQVMLNRTVGDDLFWGEPFALPPSDSQVTTDDGAQVFAYGAARVGVLWSNRGSGRMNFTSHQDGDPDETWGAAEIAASGRGLASGQLKVVASADGRVYAAVRTALDDDPSANGRSPQILLLERAAAGGWSSTLYSRLQDQQQSPSLAFDGASGIVYVTATTPKPGGTIAYKRTSADSPSFDTGTGTVFIADPSLPLIGNATTTKDPVGPESGFVMLAWDPTTARYVHGTMDLGRGVPTLPRPAKGYPPLAPQLVFKDDFDPFPVGSRPSMGWELRANDPPTAFSVVARPSRTDRSASVVNRTPSGTIRVCKAFPDTTSGDVTVDVRVRLSRLGSSDAVLTEIRGSGPAARTASVRLGKRGFFEYFRGGTKVITTVVGRPGFWYRSIVVVHLKSRTFDWKLLTASRRLILGVQGIAWRDRAANVPLDRVCLNTPTGGAGIALDWDDISVVR
jgi:hypothetical protein